MLSSVISYRTLVFLSFIGLSFSLLLFKSDLLMIWISDEEYGHGLMVIAVLGYILFQRRDEFVFTKISHKWAGTFISLVSLIIFLLGEISGIQPLSRYATWGFAVGVIISLGGFELVKKLFIPLCIILLLIPLPNEFGPILTSQLQLISSSIGVWFIRLFGGVVFLEGNVIDMGSVKLMVAEACAGLRYLFPLMSIGAILGYIMIAPKWVRWSVFLITIPVTVLMNSFRIGIVGLLSEKYGAEHTEGFLHFFEGWVVFVISLSILIMYGWGVIRLIKGGCSFSEVYLEGLYPKEKKAAINYNIEKLYTSPYTIVSITLLFIAVLSSSLILEKDKIVPNNKSLSEFPVKVGEWQTSESKLPVSLETFVGADEYYHGYLMSPHGNIVNLYVSYYFDQTKGYWPHSPRICIPGDGWFIESDTSVQLSGNNHEKIHISRLLMKKGDKTTIAYYWIKQGNKIFRKHYMARLDLVRQTLMENRADAALIRLITNVNANEKIQDADKRLQNVASEIVQILSDYVPD